MLKNNEKGFTLIELVIVIVVLGILAAFAVSRYTNMAQSARIAAVNGLAGGLRGAVAVVQGQYLINGNTAATTVTMLDSIVVTVSSGPGGGIPVGLTGGIDNAMRDFTGFNFTEGAVTAYFTPINGGNNNCRVAYTAATGIVTPDTTGC